MSILLDSLSQKEQETQRPPDIHDAHFNDVEKSFDEHDTKQANLWRKLAFVLLFLFLVSSLYYAYKLHKASGQLLGEPQSVLETKPIRQEVSKVLVEKPVEKPQKRRQSRQAESASIAAYRTPDDEGKLNVLQRYQQEQKRLEAEAEKRRLQAIREEKARQLAASSEEVVKQPKTQTVWSPSETKEVSKAEDYIHAEPAEMAADLGSAVSWESLSSEEKKRFPKLEVNSYVVSKNPNKSFVIMKSRFYKINQFITADLILRDITQTHIMIEFNDKLVKLPLK